MTVSISATVLALLLGNVTTLPVLGGLEVFSHNGPHWHHRLKKTPTRNMPKPVPLEFCNCTLCQTLLSWGSAWVTVQCIKTAKSCKFLEWWQSQNRWRWNVLHWAQTLPFGLLKNSFSYIDMWSPIVFEHFAKLNGQRTVKWPIHPVNHKQSYQGKTKCFPTTKKTSDSLLTPLNSVVSPLYCTISRVSSHHQQSTSTNVSAKQSASCVCVILCHVSIYYIFYCHVMSC